MKILALDIETTGTDHTKDRIVEIGAAVLDEHDNILDTYQTLVNPEIPIPPVASAVHHLTDADVKDAALLGDVIERLQGYDLYVAHKASFEQSFLPELGPWLCTYKTAVRVWRDAPGHSLQVLRYWRGLSDIPMLEKDAPMHRALPDALVAARIFVDLMDCTSLEQMIEWTRQPALLPRFTFGQHAMVPVEEIPHGYLTWILKADFDEDVMFTARHELKRRVS